LVEELKSIKSKNFSPKAPWFKKKTSWSRLWKTKGGGTEALTPRHAQFSHGFSHWFQSTKECSDTKRIIDFWVRKGRSESIQFNFFPNRGRSVVAEQGAEKKREGGHEGGPRNGESDMERTGLPKAG